MITEPNASKTKLHFSLDYRIISVLLLAAVVVMLLIWKPWSAATAATRTVEVTGQATLTAVPDEFVFYPAYEVKNADKQAALSELSKKTDTVVAELKKLGVPASAIKTNTSGYDYPAFRATGGDTTYSSQVTITLNDQALAQKVQDYLLTTAPTGVVSPQFGFSDKKRKELENKARDEATAEARTKAEQMGKNLGFKIGKVKSVADGTGFNGGTITYEGRSAIAADKAMPSLAINPGENELPYSVTVSYFIR